VTVLTGSVGPVRFESGELVAQRLEASVLRIAPLHIADMFAELDEEQLFGLDHLHTRKRRWERGGGGGVGVGGGVEWSGESGRVGNGELGSVGKEEEEGGV
jgi:hypothetical protein